MKKAALKAYLDRVNFGHALTINSYWVRDSYLLRIVDAQGNRLPGGYALINDNSADLATDKAEIEKLAELRDKAEKTRPKLAAPKRPDLGRPGNEFKVPTFREPDFHGLELDNQPPELDLDLSEVETWEEVLESLRDQNEDEGETPPGQ